MFISDKYQIDYKLFSKKLKHTLDRTKEVYIQKMLTLEVSVKHNSFFINV